MTAACESRCECHAAASATTPQARRAVRHVAAASCRRLPRHRHANRIAQRCAGLDEAELPPHDQYLLTAAPPMARCVVEPVAHPGALVAEARACGTARLASTRDVPTPPASERRVQIARPLAARRRALRASTQEEQLAEAEEVAK